MKRLFSIIITLLVCGWSFTGCIDEMAAPNEELDFSRCLVPTELSYKIIEGETVQFTWKETKGATASVLEIYTDSTYAGSPVVETDPLHTEDIPYTADLEPDMVYYARVKAIDEDGKLQDSKWESFKPVETYAVRPTANPVLIDRTVNSITVGWNLPEGDAELDHIRVTPPVGDDKDYTKVSLAPADVAAGKFEVKNLNPSVQYTLTLHFKSANRGSVTAWTRPSISGATVVKDTATFHYAIREGVKTILLSFADTVYNIGDVKLVAPLKLYGDSSTEGANPMVAGTFTVPGGVDSLYVEGISFDGLGYTYGHLINLGDENTDVDDITLKNCTQKSYGKGILYKSNKEVGGNVANITFDGVLVQDILGSGGDFFDLRNKGGEYGTIEIMNSTFTIGMRTAFRIDPEVKVNSLKVHNCTFNNLCFYDDGNNNGLFNVRATVTEFALSENVFLNMNDEKERCSLIAKQGAAVIPNTMANNFFFNCYDRFFVPNQDWSKVEKDKQAELIEAGKAALVVGGSKILESDPCVDSQRDVLNIVSEEVMAANAGDPRWYEAYVPVVEDLTQNVTPVGKVWDLTDGQTFKKLADKDMVRDGIRFYVKNAPVNFIETGFEFTGAGVLEVSADKETGTVSEIPVDGAIGIKVDEPGHLYLSTVASVNGTTSTPLVVNVDGKAVGSVSVGETRKQICLSGLAAGEHMIYVYPASGAVVLTEMEWDGCTLDTPEVTINKTSVMAATAEKVTLSWLHVDQAESYQITIGENVIKTSENQYVFSAESLKLADGVYNIEVVAVPATEEHLASYPAVVKLTVEVAEDPLVYSETVWDGAFFYEAVQKYFPGYESGNIAENFSYKKLRFVANDGRTDGKFTMGAGNDTYYIGIGGSGKLVEGDGKNYIQFTAAGAGTITVKATSSGDPRNVAVAVNGEEVGKYPIPSKDDAPVEHVIELKTNANDLVYIYSPSSGIRIYEIKWTPASAAPGIPSDPSAIEEAEFLNISAMTVTEIAAGTTHQEGKFTLAALSSKNLVVEPAKPRAKIGGSSEVGADGIPTGGYISFKITTPGVITHKVISSSSSDSGRKAKIALVVDGVAQLIYNENAPISSSADAVQTEVTSEMLEGATEACSIYVYGDEGAVNIHELGFEPVEIGGIPSDPTAIEDAEELNISAMTVTEIAAGTTHQEGKFTLAALSSKNLVVEPAKPRAKIGGSSEVGVDGIPTGGYISFKITTPGVITHKVISSSSSDSGRKAKIALVVDGVAQLIYNENAPISSSADAVQTEVTSEMLEGATRACSIYVYGDEGAVNIHALGFTPAK